MIVLDSPLQTSLFRAHSPRWAGSPTSGAGAAAQGGRFNRQGVEALYLSSSPTTALAEYQQTSPFLPPCTLCSYNVRLNNLVDLRQLHYGPPWDDLWQSWNDDWRHSRFDLHIEPPTWVLSDLVRDAGHTGIIFPSTLDKADGWNLVIYLDSIDGDLVEVIDPNHQLPKNQDSWPPSI